MKNVELIKTIVCDIDEIIKKLKSDYQNSLQRQYKNEIENTKKMSGNERVFHSLNSMIILKKCNLLLDLFCTSVEACLGAYKNGAIDSANFSEDIERLCNEITEKFQSETE